MWGGEAALLLRLCDALSDRLLEGPFCLRAPNRLLEWLGLLRRLHPHDRPPDSFHWRPGIPLRLHHRLEGLGHRSRVCRTGDISAR